jgi:hypothetical protein
LASIFFDRILGVAALLIIAVFAVSFSFNFPHLRGISLIILFLFIIFLLSVFLFFALKSSPLLKRIYKIKIFDLGNKLETFKNSIVLYRKVKNILAYAFFIAVVIQFLMVLVAYFTAAFLNLQVPFRYFLLFIPLIQLITFLPVTINGIGMREWAFMLLFATASGLISRMDAFALSIGFYFAILLTSLPGGVVYLLMGGEIKKVDSL